MRGMYACVCVNVLPVVSEMRLGLRARARVCVCGCVLVFECECECACVCARCFACGWQEMRLLRAELSSLRIRVKTYSKLVQATPRAHPHALAWHIALRCNAAARRRIPGCHGAARRVGAGDGAAHAELPVQARTRLRAYVCACVCARSRARVCMCVCVRVPV